MNTDTNSLINKPLDYIILSILAKGYNSATGIINFLKESKIGFESNRFYPTLSRLNSSSLLCSNWLTKENGLPEKYYFLTQVGENFLSQQKVA
jgi:PadR family transcriptional regulator, regulatory protein PadR